MSVKNKIHSPNMYLNGTDPSYEKTGHPLTNSEVRIYYLYKTLMAVFFLLFFPKWMFLNSGPHMVQKQDLIASEAVN